METELDRLIVRFIGDSASLKRANAEVRADSKDTASQIAVDVRAIEDTYKEANKKIGSDSDHALSWHKKHNENIRELRTFMTPTGEMQTFWYSSGEGAKHLAEHAEHAAHSHAHSARHMRHMGHALTGAMVLMQSFSGEADKATETMGHLMTAGILFGSGHWLIGSIVGIQALTHLFHQHEDVARKAFQSVIDGSKKEREAVSSIMIQNVSKEFNELVERSRNLTVTPGVARGFGNEFYHARQNIEHEMEHILEHAEQFRDRFDALMQSPIGRRMRTTLEERRGRDRVEALVEEVSLMDQRRMLTERQRQVEEAIAGLVGEERDRERERLTALLREADIRKLMTDLRNRQRTEGMTPARQQIDIYEREGASEMTTRALRGLFDTVEAFGQYRTMLRSINDQIRDFGVPAHEALANRLEKLGFYGQIFANVLRMQARELQSLRSEEQLEGQGRDLYTNLLQQYSVMGMSTRQAQIYAASLAGVSEEWLEAARMVDRWMTLTEESVYLSQQATQVFDRTRTPMERFEQEMEDLNELLEMGRLHWDTYTRGVAEAERRILGAGQALHRFDQAEAGSAEALQRAASQMEQFREPNASGLGLAYTREEYNQLMRPQQSFAFSFINEAGEIVNLLSRIADNTEDDENVTLQLSPANLGG